jgi:hypothetical protein
MSEQNPPSGQPTPGEPVEPVEPARADETAQLDPPTAAVGPTTNDGDAAPPADTTVTSEAPEPGRSRKPWIIGVAVVLVLALIGGGIFAAIALMGDPKHSITITSTAGGMKRDTAKEASLKQELDAADKQFEDQFDGTSVKHALYNQTSKSRGPEGQLLFVGFKFKTKSEKNPAKFIKQLDKIAASNKLKVTKVSVGDGDGRAVCVGTPSNAAQRSASCLWVTNDSAGGLFPNTLGYSPDQLSKILLDVRDDVEKSD